MTSPTERNSKDILAGQVLGIAAVLVSERIAASHKELDKTPVKFNSSECIEYAGVLLLLPFLQEAGLFSYINHYTELNRGYYDLDIIILLLSFMFLCRIKNPEQLKQISPGEYGKLLGMDRIPEGKCLRSKLKEISNQGKSSEWNMSLAKEWSSIEDNEFYYIDGHVQQYSGYLANLGNKHIAGHKLCLPGIQEFWVNNNEGQPYFYVTGEVNEKLLEMLSNKIIPSLLNDVTTKYRQEDLDSNPDLARFTLVFDREGYSPDFFKKLWNDYRIAVITYRKNVKDLWADSDFVTYTIVEDENDSDNNTEMKLSEKTFTTKNYILREIRKLSNDGHQTSIISTNRQLPIESIAKNMFLRWSQENFFKYMKQDYNFDRLVQYAVESIDCEFSVVNPEYNKLTYKLKKTREKIQRRKAKLHELNEQFLKTDLEKAGNILKKQAKEKEELDNFFILEQELKLKRDSIPYKISIKEMTEKSRYNKLHIESKYFLNIIKMICYRGETSLSNMLSHYYKKKVNEKRMLTKSIINSRGNIVADYENNSLTIQLYSESCPRMNFALQKVCDILNDTNTIYPGTNLRLIYEIATI